MNLKNFYPANLLETLQQIQLIRLQILAYSYAFSLSTPIGSYFNLHYGDKTDPKQDEDNKQIVQIHTESGQSSIRSHHFDIYWRGIPKTPKLFALFRLYTTIWLSYVVLRYVFSDQLDRLSNKFLALDKPFHCYLPGRYVLDQNVAEMTAAVFAAAHLIWRLIQALAKPYRIDAFYFLLLSERDLELIYSKLGDESQNKCLVLTLGESDQLSGKDLFTLNTLCYRTIRTTRIIFRLRANRTREAHCKLRHLVARATVIIAILIVPTTFALAVFFAALCLTDRRYIGAYPNCEPNLERLNESGQLSAWSMTFFWPKVTAMLGDAFENVAIWLESGLITTIAAASIYLVNYDLVMDWEGIEQKLIALQGDVRLAQRGPRLVLKTGVTEHVTIIGKSNDLHSRRIKDLMSEIGDFFQQIAVANKSVSNFLSGALFGGLALCCIYTYFTSVRGIRSLPPGLTIVLTWLLIVMAISCYSFLMVHRFCVRSYPIICSLMAFDHMKCEHNFGAIIEFYERRRTCFKLIEMFPFLPTTLLTIIGWGFSCFCIISSMLERKAGVQRNL